MFKKDLDLERQWQKLLRKIEMQLGVRPKDLNAVLFLIGVQELGQGSRSFTREEKQDLLHIAACKVLSLAGYYSLEGRDEDGWPHWKASGKLPHLSLGEQEKLLKMCVIDYFEQEHQWNISAESDHSSEPPTD
jgi:hypothetical protein